MNRFIVLSTCLFLVWACDDSSERRVFDGGQRADDTHDDSDGDADSNTDSYADTDADGDGNADADNDLSRDIRHLKQNPAIPGPVLPKYIPANGIP